MYYVLCFNISLYKFYQGEQAPGLNVEIVVEMEEQHQLLEGYPDIVLWDIVYRERVIGFDDEVAVLLLIESSTFFRLEGIDFDLFLLSIEHVLHKWLIILTCIVIGDALHRRSHLYRIKIT